MQLVTAIQGKGGVSVSTGNQHSAHLLPRGYYTLHSDCPEASPIIGNWP